MCASESTSPALSSSLLVVSRQGDQPSRSSEHDISHFTLRVSSDTQILVSEDLGRSGDGSSESEIQTYTHVDGDSHPKKTRHLICLHCKVSPDTRVP